MGICKLLSVNMLKGDWWAILPTNHSLKYCAVCAYVLWLHVDQDADYAEDVVDVVSGYVEGWEGFRVFGDALEAVFGYG